MRVDWASVMRKQQRNVAIMVVARTIVHCISGIKKRCVKCGKDTRIRFQLHSAQKPPDNWKHSGNSRIFHRWSWFGNVWQMRCRVLKGGSCPGAAIETQAMSVYSPVGASKDGLTRKTIGTCVLYHDQCCLPKLAGGVALPITPTSTIMVSR